MLCNTVIRYSYENTACLTVLLPGKTPWVLLGTTVSAFLLSPYFGRVETGTCIRNYKCPSYTLLPSSRFFSFVTVVGTQSCKNLYALTCPWGSGCDGCAASLITGQHILQAGSVYFGWEEETDRDTKPASCLEVTLCLLAVTFLTFKKNILFLLTKFVSWTICESRR